VEFNNECCSTYETIKKAFTTTPVLSFWVPKSQLVLETDTSDYALAVILSIISPNNGEIHPIPFHSWTFSTLELIYNVHHKELLAKF
jgi:RNase H-like domain found in reverse transcriptase